MRHLIWKIRFWWKNRWFNRNRERLRNVAAWALQHQGKGGAHDSSSVLKGCADRRIREAAYGCIDSYSRPTQHQSMSP